MELTSKTTADAGAGDVAVPSVFRLLRRRHFPLPFSSSVPRPISLSQFRTFPSPSPSRHPPFWFVFTGTTTVPSWWSPPVDRAPPSVPSQETSSLPSSSLFSPVAKPFLLSLSPSRVSLPSVNLPHFRTFSSSLFPFLRESFSSSLSWFIFLLPLSVSLYEIFGVSLSLDSLERRKGCFTFYMLVLFIQLILK